MEWKVPPARVGPQEVSSRTPHQRAAQADWDEAELWRAWTLQPLMLTGEGCEQSLTMPICAGVQMAECTCMRAPSTSHGRTKYSSVINRHAACQAKG